MRGRQTRKTNGACLGRGKLEVLTLVLLLAAGSACDRSPSDSPGTASGGDEVDFGRPVEIPAGLFIYGAGEEEFQLVLAQSRFAYPGIVERLRRMLVMPPRPVNLPRFYIDEFEVTNRQFAAFLDATGYRPEQPRNFLKHWDKGRLPDWSWDFPVTWVSPTDGEAYCRWRGGRLPTDEEWEKAARGTDGRHFPWGNDLPQVAPPNVGSGKLEPAGNRPGDVSPYGVYDLTGNVAEFTATVVEFEGHRVHTVRGGSYRGGLGNAFTFARFLGLTPDGREDSVGFRCAYDRLPGDEASAAAGN
ncbi:MAG: formylglycine-generating enzyme family protein [Acidobacteriota bacterium]